MGAELKAFVMLVTREVPDVEFVPRNFVEIAREDHQAIDLHGAKVLYLLMVLAPSKGCTSIIVANDVDLFPYKPDGVLKEHALEILCDLNLQVEVDREIEGIDEGAA